MMRYTANFIILVVLSLVLTGQCGCVHDQFIKNTTKHYYNDYIDRRLLQAPVNGPIRIFMDYTQITVGGNLQKNLIRRMMNITANYFYNLLTVQRLNRLYFPANTSQQCNVLRIPDIYVSLGTVGDLGVVVGNQNVTTAYMAKSTPCAFLASNKRPTWGVIIWNIKTFQYTNQGFQQMLFVSLHQMSHILAISAIMFNTYPTGSILKTTPAGDYYLSSPSLKAEVQSYFGCPNADGLDLQDQDGTLIASHWQKHHVGNQYMIASNKKNSYVSRFSLAIFNSTGWYPSVNYSFAQPMTWGRNKGCTFLNIDNCNFNQYCNDNSFSCDWDSTGIGRCSTDPFTGVCKVPNYFTNTICIDQNYELNNLNSGLQAFQRGGYTSRCHSSNFRLSGLAANALNNRCYVTVCSATGSFLYILVGSYTLVCRTPGLVIPAIPGLDGFLTCANDFTLYCSAKKTCAYNCNQNGACINGRCLCTGSLNFSSTCILSNPINDLTSPTGGRILLSDQAMNKQQEQNKYSLRRNYSFKELCSQGYTFDPITRTCLYCLEFLGCSKCDQNGCID